MPSSGRSLRVGVGHACSIVPLLSPLVSLLSSSLSAAASIGHFPCRVPAEHSQEVSQAAPRDRREPTTTHSRCPARRTGRPAGAPLAVVARGPGSPIGGGGRPTRKPYSPPPRRERLHGPGWGQTGDLRGGDLPAGGTSPPADAGHADPPPARPLSAPPPRTTRTSGALPPQQCPCLGTNRVVACSFLRANRGGTTVWHLPCLVPPLCLPLCCRVQVEPFRLSLAWCLACGLPLPARAGAAAAHHDCHRSSARDRNPAVPLQTCFVVPSRCLLSPAPSVPGAHGGAAAVLHSTIRWGAPSSVPHRAPHPAAPDVGPLAVPCTLLCSALFATPGVVVAGWVCLAAHHHHPACCRPAAGPVVVLSLSSPPFSAP